jgi:hypothetical protein
MYLAAELVMAVSGQRVTVVQVYAALGQPPAAAARNVLGEAVPRSIPIPRAIDALRL